MSIAHTQTLRAACGTTKYIWVCLYGRAVRLSIMKLATFAGSQLRYTSFIRGLLARNQNYALSDKASTALRWAVSCTPLSRASFRKDEYILLWPVPKHSKEGVSL